MGKISMRFLLMPRKRAMRMAWHSKLVVQPPYPLVETVDQTCCRPSRPRTHLSGSSCGTAISCSTIWATGATARGGGDQTVRDGHKYMQVRRNGLSSCEHAPA